MTDPDTIANWHRIDDRLTTSGQPSDEGLQAVAALGVRTVINLALHSHPRALADEAAVVAGLGMRYVHIPVAFDAPTEDDFAHFAAAMTAADAPVHVHCIVNARVSAFVYRYRTRVQSVPAHEAQRDLDALWRPGGVWASFIGKPEDASAPHRPGTGPNRATVA